MAPGDLPASVVAFVNDHIDSVRQLEVLLIVRDGGTRRWTATALSRELRSPEVWTAQQLEELYARGLFGREQADGSDASFWYQPFDSDLDRAVGQVADCFRRRKTRVVSLILSSDVADPLRSFSDAFRIRRER